MKTVFGLIETTFIGKPDRTTLSAHVYHSAREFRRDFV